MSRKVNLRLLFVKRTKKLIETDKLSGTGGRCDIFSGYTFSLLTFTARYIPQAPSLLDVRHHGELWSEYGPG